MKREKFYQSIKLVEGSDFILKKETDIKLQVLKKAGKLTESDLKFLNRIDKDLKKYDNSDKEEMLLIHVGMSLDRSRNNTAVEEMPLELWKQIISKPKYQQARLYWEKIQPLLPSSLGHNEEQYILMHLVNVMSVNER